MDLPAEKSKDDIINPPEKQKKIGVFICACGKNIGNVVDVDANRLDIWAGVQRIVAVAEEGPEHVPRRSESGSRRIVEVLANFLAIDAADLWRNADVVVCAQESAGEAHPLTFESASVDLSSVAVDPLIHSLYLLVCRMAV